VIRTYLSPSARCFGIIVLLRFNEIKITFRGRR